MNVAVARPSARQTGFVYLAYAGLAAIGQVLATLYPASDLAAAAQVVGTVWYAVAAVFLVRLFGGASRAAAGALALVTMAIGCILQSLYYALGLGRGAELLALTFFGLFLIFLGYLVIRSELIPRAIGIWLVAGGLAWFLVLLPIPAVVAAPVILLAGSSELALLLWLLIRGTRR